jgi:hypothetical protein
MLMYDSLSEDTMDRLFLWKKKGKKLSIFSKMVLSVTQNGTDLS